MTDIVEELRNRTTGIVLLSAPPQFQKDGLCQQAADEILRLRAENEKLREETRSKGERIGGYVNMLVKREAEIEKLRAALKPFSCKHIGFQAHCDDGLVVPVSVELGHLRTAAAALKENPDE